MTYQKVLRHSASGVYRRNPKVNRSAEEEEFLRLYGGYPSERELKQFLPYIRFKKKTFKYDLMFKV